MSGFDYVWVWKPHPDQPWMTQLDRRWQRCRVVARGEMNSALIEFKDGFRVVVSRNGIQIALTRETERDLRQVLAELELISHVSAFNYESSTGGDHGEDIGGRRPPGGIDRRGDAPDNADHIYPQKSVEHFRRRLRNVHTQWRAEIVLKEARAALVAARRQPAPLSQPEISSPQWKRWVAESSLSSSEIARKYACSRQYVDKVRAQYRTAA